MLEPLSGAICDKLGTNTAAYTLAPAMARRQVRQRPHDVFGGQVSSTFESRPARGKSLVGSEFLRERFSQARLARKSQVQRVAVLPTTSRMMRERVFSGDVPVVELMVICTR